MRKIFCLLFLSIILSCGFLKANAMTFEEAFNDRSKPMLVLVYAQWADNYIGYVNAFKAIQTPFADNFNFVELDIATADTKAFNSRYHIYPNLPYVLMFRDGGKVSRYIQRDCVLNNSCFTSRLKSFLQ